MAFDTLIDYIKSVWTGSGGGSDSLRVTGTITATPTGTQDVNVTQYGSTATTLGQKAMTASQPVVIASDQSAVPVSGTFFQATQPVSGPLTDAQLRATPVPLASIVMLNDPALPDSSITLITRPAPAVAAASRVTVLAAVSDV